MDASSKDDVAGDCDSGDDVGGGGGGDSGNGVGGGDGVGFGGGSGELPTYFTRVSCAKILMELQLHDVRLRGVQTGREREREGRMKGGRGQSEIER